MFDADAAFYLDLLKTGGRISQNTFASYRSDLDKFGTYARDCGALTVDQIDQTLIRDYLHKLRLQGMGESSIRRVISTLRGFFRSLQSEGRIQEDPMAGIVVRTETKDAPGERPSRILTVAETARLLAAPPDTNTGKRDRAILQLLYSAGMRPGEVARLRIRDINFLVGEALVTEEDGQTRTAAFGVEAGEAIREYLRANQRQFVNKNDILFLGRDFKPLSRQSIWKLVKKYAEKAGLRGSVTPQVLRSSLASHLLQHGADLESVRRLLGHESLTTTRQYASGRDQKLRQVMEHMDRITKIQ